MPGLGFILSPADSPVHVPAGLHEQGLLIAHQWGSDRLAGSLLRLILSLFQVCSQSWDLMAECPSQGCCAVMAPVLLARAKALLPACCLGSGLRCLGSPARQQTSGSWGGGPCCGDPHAVAHSWLVACPYQGAEAAGRGGMYPDISIFIYFFQTEQRGTPQSPYWGAGEGRGRKQGRYRGLSK